MDKFMKAALVEAQKAFDIGEVPVGCVIVKDGHIIARAHNERETRQSATAHAEILCIERACRKLKSFRLDGCDMYLTLEPCAMCSGAVINARIKTLYFGASDLNYGCAGSRYNLTADKSFEHAVEVVPHVMEEECAFILDSFFKKVREKNRVKNYLGKTVKFEIVSGDECFENGRYSSPSNCEKIIERDEKTHKNTQKTSFLPPFLIKFDNFTTKAFIKDNQKKEGIVDIILEEMGSFNVYLLIGFDEENIGEVLSYFPKKTKLKVITNTGKKIVSI